MTRAPLTPALQALAQREGFALSVLFSDISKPHTDYKPDQIADYEALYEGGDLFAERIDRFLVKRQSEGAGTPNYARTDPRNENKNVTGETVSSPSVLGNTYDVRKQYAWYENVGGGFIDFIRSAVLSSRPVIVAATPPKTDPASPVAKLLAPFARLKTYFGIPSTPDARTQYWVDLNCNCDGAGHSLPARKSDMLRSLLLHKRAYIGVRFGDGDYTSIYNAKMAGKFDAKLCFFSAQEIDNWGRDDDGNLAWLRRHRVTEKTIVPTSPDKTIKEQWSFFTPTAIYTYALDYKADNKPTPQTPVQLVSVVEHGLGQLPVQEVRIGIHVMQRLAPIILKLFNRQSAITWSLNLTAYALLCIFSNDDLSQGFDADGFALQLKTPNSSCDFKTPNPGIYDPQFKDAANTRDALYEALMAMVLKAASMASNGRQSADAKRADFDTFETFLEIFSEPLKAKLTWAVKLIQSQRPDDKDLLVNVEGLDEFDIDTIAAILKNTLDYISIPGMPETAVKYAKLRATRAMLKNAPAEVLHQSITEIAESDDTEPPVAPPKPEVPPVQV